MSQQSELELLRAVLGRGPTDMLMWLAKEGGWSGSLKPRIVHVRTEKIRKYRLKLEAAGLIRTTYQPGPGMGYAYEIIRPEDLPIQQALEEWLHERAEVRRSREVVTA